MTKEKKQTKAEKKRQKRERQILKKKGLLPESGDEAGDDDGIGLCPCVMNLNMTTLQTNLQTNAVTAWCEGCAMDTAKANGKAKKGKSTMHQPSFNTEDILGCLSCGYTGCKAKHAYEHFEKHKKRNIHSVYLQLADATHDHFPAKCFSCQLDVRNPLFPLNEVESCECVRGRNVNFEGYLIDEDEEFAREYRACCTQLLDVHAMGDEALPEFTMQNPKRQRNKNNKNNRFVAVQGRKKQHKQHNGNGGGGGGTFLDPSASAAGLKGLTNFGNTCFMNSVMQLISWTPGLHDALQKKSEGRKGPVTAAVSALLVKVHSGKDQVSSLLRGVLTEIQKAGPQFRGYYQHDAQEYLRFLTDTIELEHAASGATAANPFQVAYGGKLNSTLCCGDCEQSSTVEEPFYDFSLSITRSVDESLDAFFSPEPLTDCKYPCSTCNKAQFEAYQKRIAEERAQAINATRERGGSVEIQELLKNGEEEVEEEEEEDNEEEEEEEEEEDEADDTPVASLPSPSNSPPAPEPVERVPDKIFTTAFKQYSIKSLPSAVVLHLKRFAFCPRRVAYVKDTRQVTVQETISLKRHMHPDADPVHPPVPEVPAEYAEQFSDIQDMFPAQDASSLYSILETSKWNLERAISNLLETGSPKPPTSDPFTYHLTAVIEHKGEVGYGHYIAYVRVNHTWFKCDDNHVTQSSLAQACSMPYVMLYSRA